MGIDIGGNTIVKNASNFISINSLVFSPSGHGTTNSIPGYAAWKSGGSTYYSAPSGWELNAATWQSGLNLSNGVFTCPVAGLYAMGYNGLHRGGSNIPAGYNTYGYAGFAKNGALSYFVHWNQSTGTYWNVGGTSALFSCAAGDTLALFVNRPPSPNGPDVYSQNYGLYPSEHQCVWCKLVG
ncbi:MAG TPA: hypothetical protein VIZ32_22975 [Vicinamibacterales bacterium]